LLHKHSDESAAQYCVASQERRKQPELLMANDTEIDEHANRRLLENYPPHLGTAAFCLDIQNVMAGLMGSTW
jgi:hypothetical protein